MTEIGELAREQVAAGARVVDVNVAMPGIREVEALPRAVEEVQRAVTAPLCLDSSAATRRPSSALPWTRDPGFPGR